MCSGLGRSSVVEAGSGVGDWLYEMVLAAAFQQNVNALRYINYTLSSFSFYFSFSIKSIYFASLVFIWRNKKMRKSDHGRPDQT